MKTASLRFATVRNPAPSDPSAQAIPFDPAVLTTEKSYEKSLFKQLRAILGNEKLTPAQRVEKVRSAVATFKSSGSLIATDAQFDDAFPGFERFRHWLTSTSKVTVDAIHLNAEKLLGFSRGKVLSGERLLTLTDSLIALIILNERPRLRERISFALRINNIVNKAGNAEIIRGASDLRKLIGAPVILPDAVFLPILKAEKHADSAKPKDSAVAEKERHLAEMARLTAAYDELIEVRGLQIPSEIEADRTTPDSQSAGAKRKGKVPKGEAPSGTMILPKGPASFNVHKEHIALMSPATKAVLGELRISEQTKYSDALSKIEKAGRKVALHVAKGIIPYKRQFLIGGKLINLDEMVLEAPQGPGGLAQVGNEQCDFQFPFKIADLRIVEQELKDYLAGEVAHVENILQGEMKERTTRRLKRTEETLYTSSEREETNEKDSQTTDRFSLEKEISKTIKADTEAEINGKVHTEYYGPVIVKADLEAGYSTSNSTEQSTREAVNYAKEVVQRSAQKIVERVKEERTVKTTEEFEENNRHVLNNVGGTHHVVGVYRWLNKEYTVWLKNYGKRLMFELMIPEPAAYHLFAMTQKPDSSGISLESPLPPLDLGLVSHKSIDSLNYPTWAAAYGAQVTPPPAQAVVVAGSLSLDYLDGQNIVGGTINIPTGYAASLSLVFAERANGGWGNIQVGLRHTWGDHPTWPLFLNNETLSLPIHVVGGLGFLIAHIDVECAVTPEFYEAWQIKTYNTLIGAYEAKKAAYDNALAEARANAGVVIRGTNPLFNKTVIATELKKNAIRLMTHCNPLVSSAMGDEGDFNCCQVMAEAPYIKFVEQVFEWRNMVYEFYAYHWAAKDHWLNLYNLSDTDPLFQNFLKAGYARVLVPVTPGFAQAAMNFVTLGTPNLNDLAAMPVMDVINGMDEDVPTLEAARVSTQSNIDLSAPGTDIDGVTIVPGDRVLVRDQDLLADNGVYVWNGGAVPMTRAADADDQFELNQAVIEVKAGSDTGFAFRQTETLEAIGTDPLIFQIAAEIINESLLIPTDLTMLECKSAGVEPTTMKILGLCATAGVMSGGAQTPEVEPADEH